jgi:hypothetical protein
MHKIMLLISKTCFPSLVEFDENTNHIKFQTLEILNQKTTRGKNVFLPFG